MNTFRTESNASPRLGSAADTCLTAARIGIAHEFFGHLYEAVGRIPHRFAQDLRPGAPDRRMPSLRGPGSPLRYFAPVAPISVAAILAALVANRRTPGTRRWIAAATAAFLSSDVLTIYIIRALNTRLFVVGPTLTPTEQNTLLRTWYRLNAGRIALCGGAWLAAAIAQKRLTSPIP